LNKLEHKKRGGHEDKDFDDFLAGVIEEEFDDVN